MHQYLQLAQHVLQHGSDKPDRTGVGTRSVFGWQSRYDLAQGFPLITTKKLHIPSIVHELLWFIKGETNIAYLKANNIRIWDEWADADGELGPIYGKQWRDWRGADGTPHDQLAEVLRLITHQPDSRRIIMTAWNPSDIAQSALPPCHILSQFYVANHTLSCQFYQRSADIFLGVPFNIASYALLTHILAHLAGLKPGVLVHSLGDAHIYRNHIDSVKLQLSRQPRPLPTLRFINPPDSLDQFAAHHIAIDNYTPHPHIKGEVAI